MTKCRAKKPSECRYHGAVMRVESAIVAGDYDSAISAYFDARANVHSRDEKSFDISQVFSLKNSPTTDDSGKKELDELHQKIVNSLFQEIEGQQYPISVLKNARKYGSYSGLKYLTIDTPEDVAAFEKYLEDYPKFLPGGFIKYEQSYTLPGGGKVFEGISYCHPNPTIWENGKVRLAKTKSEYDAYYSTRKNSTVESFIKTLPSGKIPKKSFRFGPKDRPDWRGYTSTGTNSLVSSSPKEAENIMQLLKESKNTVTVNVSFDGIIDLADGNKVFINPRYSYTQRDEEFAEKLYKTLKTGTDMKKYDDPNFFDKTEKMFGLKF